MGLQLYMTFAAERAGGANKRDPENNGTWDGVSVASQFEWLEKDLTKANANRAAVPWIVLQGHRSIYCSCDGDCDSAAEQVRDGVACMGQANSSLKCYGIEELLFRHGVDLYINGHEHNYERNWPTFKGNAQQSNTNPNATIYIVQGAAGCGGLSHGRDCDFAATVSPVVEAPGPKFIYQSGTGTAH